MTADLKTQIHDFAQEFGSALPPIDLEDLIDPKMAAEYRPTQRPRGWVVVLAAMTAVIVLMGGLALLLNVNSQGEPPGSGVIAPSGPVEPVPGQWVMVPGGEVFEASIVDGIAAGENGLVAVGVEKLESPTSEPTPTIVGEVNADPSERAAVWVSVDGTSWNRLPHDSEVFGTNGRLGYIVAGGPGYVIAGDVDGASRIWTSEDGTSWSRFAAPAEAALVTGLTTNDRLLIAEGFVRGEEVNHTGIWTSDDGSTWTYIPEVASAGNPIVAAGPTIVVLGQTCESIDRDQGITSCEPTVWTSTEGDDWERHQPSGVGPWDDQGPVPDVTMAWFRDQLVAVAGGLGAWTSIDGVTWESVPQAAESFAGRVAVGTEDGEILPVAYVAALAASRDRLVAVGTARTEQGEVAAIWTSIDGVSWSKVPHDPAVFGQIGEAARIRQVTTTRQGFVAMGGFTDFWAWVEDTP